jgi:hypothetical protein
MLINKFSSDMMVVDMRVGGVDIVMSGGVD